VGPLAVSLEYDYLRTEMRSTNVYQSHVVSLNGVLMF